MRKLFTACILIACVFSAFYSHAQTTKKFSFGFGIEGALVTGDAKEVYSFAPGITIRGSYKLGPGYATLTTGALIFLPKDFEDEDLKAGLQIPVKAGYKFLISDHFFVMGEIGFSSFKSYYEGYEGEVMSTTSSGFTYAPCIGVQFGKFELSARYEATSLEGSTLSTPALRIGFNF